MQRSIVDAVPTLATPTLDHGEATTITVRRPVPRWLFFFGFWTLIVLAYSTRGDVRVGPYQWVSRTPSTIS